MVRISSNAIGVDHGRIKRQAIEGWRCVRPLFWIVRRRGCHHFFVFTNTTLVHYGISFLTWSLAAKPIPRSPRSKQIWMTSTK